MPNLRDSLALQKSGVICLIGAGGKTTLMFALARELTREGGSVLTTTTTKIFPPTPGQSPELMLAETAAELLTRHAALPAPPAHLSAATGEVAGTGKLAGFPPQEIDQIRQSGRFDWILVEADGAARRGLKMAGPREPVIPSSATDVVVVAGLDVLGKPLDDRWVFRSRLYAAVTGLPLGEPVSEASLVKAILAEEGIARGTPPGVRRHLFLNKAEDEETLEAGRRIAGLLAKPHPNRPGRILIGRAGHEIPVTEVVELEG